MDVATVSVIVSGAVGIGVPLGTMWMTEKRRARDTLDARFDELRDVVDAAAVALMAVRDAEPDTADGFKSVRNALPAHRNALQRVRQQEARLAARLGSDAALVRSYRDAQEALLAVHDYWIVLTRGETPPDDFADANAAVPPAVESFFAIASTVIGPNREAVSEPSKK